MVLWIDIRTKAGKHRKAMAVERATELRARGMTFAEIAPIVGVSASTLAMSVPWRLTTLNSLELEDARKVVVEGRDRNEVTLERRERQRAGWLAYKRQREEARQARAGQRRKVREVARAERRVRKKRVRAQRQAEIAFRKNWESPVRLDKPIGERGDAVYGDLVASDASWANPQKHVEAAEIRSLLGDLSVDDVERLNEETLERLRDKLREAGYSGLGVPTSERERLKEPEPHRGSSGRPERLVVPAEDPDSDLIPRERGSKKDRLQRMKNRKARGDQDQKKMGRNKRGRQHVSHVQFHRGQRRKRDVYSMPARKPS